MLVAEIIGNLGADPEIYSDAFRLSVAHSSKTRIGDNVTEQTTWVSVFLPREKENIVRYLRKGAKVYCRGNLKARCFKGADGAFHSGLNIYASFIEICTYPDTLNTQPVPKNPKEQSSEQQETQDEELPF